MKTSLFIIAAVTLQLASGQHYEPRRLRATRGLQDMSMGKAEKVASEKMSKESSAKSGKVSSAKSEKV